MATMRDFKWFMTRHGVLIVAFAACLAGVFFSIQGLVQQRELIEKESRINIWFLAQAEIEFIRFTESLKDYALDPNSETAGETQDRFEIFWSRLLPLLEGRQTAELRNIDGLVPLVENMISELEALEPTIYGLESLPDGALSTISEKLDYLRAPVHDMVRRGLLYESDEVSRARDLHNSLYIKLLGLFALILVGVFTILVMLCMQIIKTNRAVQAKDQAATQAIRARTELELAINSISEGFIIFDQNDRVELFNQRYVDLHPMQADDLVVGVSFQDLLRSAVRNGGVVMPPEEVEDWIADVTEQRRATKSTTFESRLSNGVWLHISERWTSDGRLVGVHTDITELKERERLVSEKTELLQTTLDNMKHGIAVFDDDMRLKLYNHRFLEINEYSQEMVDANSSYGDLIKNAASRGDFGPGDPNELVDRMISSIKDLLDKTAENERWARNIGDGRVVEVVASALPTGGFVKTYEDITERTAAEAERARLTEMYHASQRTQALGTLAGGIAHDFNNIIGGILGNCSLLISDLPKDSALQKRVTQIIESGTRARDLVRQILTYSRNAGSDRKPLDLKSTVLDSLEAVKSQIPATVSLEIGALERCFAEADATQVHQLLVNICQNAAQAIGAGVKGKITVSMETCVIDGTDDPMPQLSAGNSVSEGRSANGHLEDLEPGRYVRIGITDTGPGIPAEIMPRIFEPFFTTKKIGEGTGLGLAAVQGIVRNHGGAVLVESLERFGTRFDIYLPAVEEPAAAAVEKRSAKGPTSRGSERLLLIDDDDVLLGVSQEILTRLGYTVDAFGDANEALEAFRGSTDAWDLVITDRKMPNITGEDVAAAVRAARSDIPIVMLSGFVSPDEHATILSRGVTTVVGKPVLPDELLAAVKSALGQENDVSTHPELELSKC